MTVARPISRAGGYYDSPAGIIAMAPDRVNPAVAFESAPGHRAGIVEHRDRAGPELRLEQCGDHAGLSARPNRNCRSRAITRLVSRCTRQTRGQTGCQAAQSGRTQLLSGPVALGGGLVATGVSPPGAGDGRLNAW